MYLNLPRFRFLKDPSILPLEITPHPTPLTARLKQSPSYPPTNSCCLRQRKMGLLDTLFSFRGPLTLLLVIFGPSVLPRIHTFWRRRNQPSSQPIPSEPLPITLKALLALNTIYHCLHLYYPPYDLFTANNLPVLAPNALIRRAILGHHSESSPSDPASHPVVELLLQRLQNADNRINYARFGHQPLIECVWCTSPDDYLIYSVPAILAVYVGSAILLGTISLKAVSGESAERRAEKWRSTVGLGLGGLCVADLASRYFWDLRPVQGDCLHVSQRFFPFSHVSFSALPLELNASYQALFMLSAASHSSLSPLCTLTFPSPPLWRIAPLSFPHLLNRSMLSVSQTSPEWPSSEITGFGVWTWCVLRKKRGEPHTSQRG